MLIATFTFTLSHIHTHVKIEKKKHSDSFEINRIPFIIYTFEIHIPRIIAEVFNLQ